MTLDEMNIKLGMIERDYEERRNAVVNEYIRSNAKYGVGYKLVDSIGMIEVISVTSGSNPDDILYYGKELSNHYKSSPVGNRYVFEYNVRKGYKPNE